MEEKKIVNIEEATEVKESKIKNFGSKVVNGVKKHGKAILMIGLAGLAGAAGYALGHKALNGDSDVEDVDWNDVTDGNSEETNTEE